MKHVLTPEQSFYVRSMGKLLRITAIFTSDEEANKYMAEHSEAAVIADFGGFVFTADKWDKGVQL